MISPLMNNWRIAAVALALALWGTAPVLAQDAAGTGAEEAAMPTGCAAFKWPLDKEREAFAGPGLEIAASGAARGALKEQAFALTLVPQSEVPFTLPPPQRKRDSEKPRFGGIVAFAAPEKAGTYQVTLSGQGWIDFVQQGASLKAADHSGVKDCPGLRKSVRFKVTDAPVVLQISGAPAQNIKIAIRPVE